MPDQDTASFEARLRHDFAQEGALFPGLTDPEPRIRKAAALRARRTRVLVVRAAIVTVIVAAGAVTLTRNVSVQRAGPALTAGLGSSAVQSPLFCLSSTWCVAEASGGFAPPAILWSWNGKRWAAMPDSPALAADTHAYINDFACSLPTQCVAVGYHEADVGQFQSRNVPLTLEWDGSSWKQTPIMPGPENTSAELDSVACPALDDCIAVGATTEGALTEDWDGERWAVVANPLAEIRPYAALTTGGLGGDALESLSCPSPRFCAAVGPFTYLGQPGLLARLVAQKRIAVPRHGNLSGVTVVELWNGARWSAVVAPYAPNIGATETDGFAEVACASTTACIAVGRPPTADLHQNAVDVWNSQAWQAATMPGTESSLQGPPQLSCTSGLCMDAFQGSASAGSTVISVELWRGSGWSAAAGLRVPVPAAPAYGAAHWTAVASGLTCSSAHFCLAIGVAGGEQPCSAGESYLASWNGTEWTVATYARFIPPRGCI